MAYGTLKADVVQSSTAGTPPQFNDGNGTQTGTLCRAWVNFNGTGTVAIRGSFNVSSITDNGNGDYTVNYTTAFPDANFAFVVTGGDTGSSALFSASQSDSSAGNTTTTSRFRLKYQSGTTTTVADGNQISAAVFR